MNEPSISTNPRFKNYPLLQTLIERRSRRFAPGMKLEGGPLSFESKRVPQPLTEEDEAALTFAACGVTGMRWLNCLMRQGRSETLVAEIS
jgi:hypothetical protein